MKCQWFNCNNEGITVVIREATAKEQEELASYSGIIASIPKYHRKIVCDSCLEEARKEYPLTEAEAVF